MKRKNYFCHRWWLISQTLKGIIYRGRKKREATKQIGERSEIWSWVHLEIGLCFFHSNCPTRKESTSMTWTQTLSGEMRGPSSVSDGLWLPCWRSWRIIMLNDSSQGASVIVQFNSVALNSSLLIKFLKKGLCSWNWILPAVGISHVFAQSSSIFTTDSNSSWMLAICFLFLCQLIPQIEFELSASFCRSASTRNLSCSCEMRWATGKLFLEHITSKTMQTGELIFSVFLFWDSRFQAFLCCSTLVGRVLLLLIPVL